ncbi:MAG: hypothetical protein AB7I27_14570 [Bacteriovoracaceae bacterium]
MKNLILATLSLVPVLSWGVELPHQNELFNYEFCEVTILKDGEELSKNLLTTFRPSPMIRQFGDTTYHYPQVAVSHCFSEPLDDRFNKNNLYYIKKTKQYLDVCYRLSNGVQENKDGYAEIYLALQGTEKNLFRIDYLNQRSPIVLKGTEMKTQMINDYQVQVDCKNTMLTPTDSVWAQIKQHRLGKQ